MKSCKSQCCFQTKCNNPGNYSFNVVRAHRLCEEHFNIISTFPSIVCSHCNAVCKVNPGLMQKDSVINPFHPKPQSSEPFQGSYFNFAEVKSMVSDENLSQTIENGECQNCGKFTQKIITRSCKHRSCINCNKATKCIICEDPNSINFEKKNLNQAIQKDFNVEEIKGSESIISKFSHSEQFKSKNEETKISFSAKQDQKNLPSNEMRKNCHNCKNNAIPRQFNNCEHVGCEKCWLSKCYSCENIKICIECKRNKVCNLIKECEHDICYECYSSKIKCSKCFFKCSNCSQYNKLIETHAFNSEKKLCNKCYQHQQNNLNKCLNCNKTATNFIDTCSHFICYDCFNQLGCCSCKKNEMRCFSCQNIAQYLIDECNHFICKKCSDTIGRCTCKDFQRFFMAKCEGCGIPEFCSKAICGHDFCKMCTEQKTGCRKCYSLLVANQIICDNCKSNKKLIKINSCNHISCESCLQLYGECFVCFNWRDLCKFCLSKKPNSYAGCNHPICQDCNKNVVCFTCLLTNKIKIANNKEKMVCNGCQKTMNTILITQCNHYLCRNCFKKTKNLDFRCPSCVNSISNNVKCISCAGHPTYQEQSQDIVNKLCCNILICKKCLEIINEFPHKCKIKNSIVLTMSSVIRNIFK